MVMRFSSCSWCSRCAWGAALLVSLVCPLGCAGMQQDFQRQFTPGQLDDSSHIHAYMAANLAFSFLSGHMVEWDARLVGVQDDLPAFFAALDKSAYRFELRVVPHQVKGDLQYEFHDVHLVLQPKTGKGETFELPGAPGTRVVDYVKALAPAAKTTGIPAEVLRRGHFALYMLDGMLGSLSATDDALRRHVFGLLVLKDRLQRKEPNADNLARLRPPERSIEDVDLALRVMADHFGETQRLRVEALALMALASRYETPAARTALTEQADSSRRNASAWEAEHHRPTMEEFGVGMKEFKLPTPENMLSVLDQDGYLTAAVTVAKGIASGDVSTTVEGLGKLAPPNSSLRIASEGAAAALRGDVGAVANAVGAIAQGQDGVTEVTQRLKTVEQAVARGQGAAESVR